MICPKCSTRMLVKDSRTDDEGTVRKYFCPKCKSLVYTKEMITSKYEVNNRLNAIMKKRYKDKRCGC